MAKQGQIEFEITGNSAQFDKSIDGVKILARDTKKELDKQLLFNLELNVAELQKKLEDSRKLLARAKKEGDKETELTLRIQTNEYTRNLTEAKRQLNNYLNTGDTALSRLQAKFNQVTDEIKLSRDELVKVGKNTAGLDKLIKKADDLQKEFEQGKISLNKFEAGMKDIQRQANNVGGGISSLGGILKSFGGTLVAFFAVDKVLDFGKQSIIAFSNFEKGLANINTVLRVSQKELATLGEGIKQVAETYGIANEELQKTAFNIASAGVEYKNINSILALSAQVALSAQTDTTTAFNGLIAVVKKYGLDLTESTNIANLFFKTNELGQTTVGDLASALQNLTSTAPLAGVSLTDLFATYSTLTGVTGDANAVTTQLNGAINALAAPTTEASALFKKLGIEVGASAIEQKGLAGVSKEIYEATGGNLEVLRRLIPEVEATKLVVALATTQYDKFTSATNQLTNSQGSLELALSQVTKTTDFQLKVATQKWENFKIGVGNVIVQIGAFLYNISNTLISFGKLLGKVFGTGLVTVGEIVYKGLGFIFNNFKTFVNNSISIFKSLAENIGIAFGNIPALIGKGLDKGSQVLNKWLNSAINSINSIGSKLGIGAIGPANIQTSLGAGLKEFKPLGNLQDFIPIGNLDLTVKAVNSVQDEFENLKSSFNDFGNTGKTAQKVFGDLTVSSQKFGSELIDTTENAQKALDKLQTGGTSKAQKEAEKLLEEQKKEEEKQVKERIARLKKLQEAQEKTDENAKKSAISLYDEVNNNIDKSKDKVQAYQDEIDKLKDKFTELKDNAKKDIDDINSQLEDLQIGTDTKLSERKIELLDRETEIQKELNKLQKEGVNTKKAQSIGLPTLESIGTGDIGGNKVEDLIKVAKLIEEQNKLKEEQKLLDKNINEANFTEAQRLAGLTETQRILEEQKTNQAILEERKKINESIIAGEEINLNEIQNKKNIAYAQDLIEKQNQIQADLDLQEEKLNAELEIENRLYKAKKLIADEYFSYIKDQIELEKVELRSLVEELKNAKTAIKEAELAKQQVSQYTKNINMGGVNVTNGVDGESLLRQINQ